MDAGLVPIDRQQTRNHAERDTRRGHHRVGAAASGQRIPPKALRLLAGGDMAFGRCSEVCLTVKLDGGGHRRRPATEEEVMHPHIAQSLAAARGGAGYRRLQ
jgi:hypothetical protein